METPEYPSGKYLTFRVARIEFAMDATRVRGILPAHELMEVAAVPGDPAGLAGYAALRGREFPVIDLRVKLGLPHGSHGRTPCIVVVEAGTPEGPRTAGFIADRVSEVVDARVRDFRHGRLRIGRPRRVIDADIVLGEVEATL